MHFTEDMFEQAVIELLENMGYTHIYAPDMERDYSSPLLDAELMDSLVKLNKGLPLDAITEAVAKLCTFDAGSLVQKNMVFMDYLQNGLTVKYFDKGEERSTLVKLIDYANVKNNSFYVVNQFTYGDISLPFLRRPLTTDYEIAALSDRRYTVSSSEQIRRFIDARFSSY